MDKVKRILKVIGKFVMFLFILFILFWLFYFVFVRTWHLNWGAESAELNRRWIGDSLVNNPQICLTRSITIKESPDKIWKWINQLGQSRGGFYSYDWLENLLALDIHNVYEIRPDLQLIKPGDTVKFSPEGGLPVQIIEPNKAFIIHSYMSDSSKMIKDQINVTWGFLLDERGEGITRLIARFRFDIHLEITQMFTYYLFNFFMLEPAHFIMERKMLLTLKNLSEHGSPYSQALIQSETVSVISIIIGLLGIIFIYGFGKNWRSKVFIASVLFICINLIFWIWYTYVLPGIGLVFITIGLVIFLLKINLSKKSPKPKVNDEEAKTQS
jgi:hypothetical protein